MHGLTTPRLTAMKRLTEVRGGPLTQWDQLEALVRKIRSDNPGRQLAVDVVEVQWLIEVGVPAAKAARGELAAAWPDGE